MMPMPMAMPMPAPQLAFTPTPPAPAGMVALPQINQVELNSKPDEAQKKQYLGNLLYANIAKVNEPLAGKITGMIIDLPMDQVLQNCQDQNMLNQTVMSAINLLNQQQSQPQQQPQTNAQQTA